MVRDFYVTKLGMTQAWTTTGKRLAITRCQANDLPVISVLDTDQGKSSQKDNKPGMIMIGLGQRKLDNVKKPLKAQIKKSGFSFGVRQVKGVELSTNDEVKPGSSINVGQVINIGDVVQVQGTSKGRGFAGGIKRHGFHGGPKTHGQSDRERAVGSIGAGTYPGRVWKGKKMPGHYGNATATVRNLVVVHIDPKTNELWLSGPVPGSISGQLRLRKTNQTKQVDLDRAASQLPEEKTEPNAEEQVSDAKSVEAEKSEVENTEKKTQDKKEEATNK